MDYVAINRASWNALTEVNVASEFYDVKGFLEGKNTLTEIEIPLLGNLQGKRVLHLQCHFGQDSISMARMGASITGVDLSDHAIAHARAFAAQTGADATFICCNLYDLPQHLDEQFDVVFSSYGTITWLPDLEGWASLIARYLRKGGVFVFAEFHPVVWMFDNHFTNVAYNYFNTGPIEETESGSYADRSADIERRYIGWNHSLGEVWQCLLGKGLVPDFFDEYDFSPYQIFSNGKEVGTARYRPANLEKTIPLVYALRALKA